VTTTVVYSGTADGYAYGQSATYATARSTAYAADSASDYGYVGQFPGFVCIETFLGFDTSGVGTDTVSAVVLRLTSAVNASDTDFTIEARVHDWGASLTTGDYVAGADLSAKTLLAHYATSGGWTAETAYDFVDDAFPANVNKTGTTNILLDSDRHAAGTEPTGDEYIQPYTADVDGTGTTRDPKLTVTHAATPVVGMPTFRRLLAARRRVLVP
jgi:hypothetical protein